MALSATEIEYVLHEIAPVLVQGRIQKIHQPGDRLLLFDIRMPGETHRLLISVEPETARLHLLSGPLQTRPVLRRFVNSFARRCKAAVSRRYSNSEMTGSS